MQVQITKWGNSLGLRIPRSLAQQTGISEGQRVDINVDGANLVVMPAKPLWKLDDLLINMTPEAMSDAFSWGEDQGREAVDD